MTNTKKALNILTISVFAVFTSATAFAHSQHDHSMYPYKWAFSNNLEAKVERNINADRNDRLVGLNHLEQKKLDHYGIDVGNRFQSSIRGVDVTAQRTTAGVKILSVNTVSRSGMQEIVPIRPAWKATNVSTAGNMSHAGHDHGHLPYEWIFAGTTTAKMTDHMNRGNDNIMVGLTNFEQNLLDEYNIKVGNTFHTTIAGHEFIVERTSAGVRVHTHAEAINMARAVDNADHNDSM